MTADSSPTLPPEENTSSATPSLSQVYLTNEGEKMLLILPPELEHKGKDWAEIWQELKFYLKSSENNWESGTSVTLQTHNRLVDQRQLQAIAEALQEVNLQLTQVKTQRRQTAVMAATAGYSVEQETLQPSFAQSSSDSVSAPLAQPRYLKQSIRSGVDVSHPGTLIILGDVNPGGSVTADGDILVWGSLRGTVHAGARGNPACQIMALRMEPSLLRIADAIARAPDSHPDEFIPEVAYLTPDGIRIAPALNFAKTHTFDAELGVWLPQKPLI